MDRRGTAGWIYLSIFLPPSVASAHSRPCGHRLRFPAFLSVLYRFRACCIETGAWQVVDGRREQLWGETGWCKRRSRRLPCRYSMVPLVDKIYFLNLASGSSRVRSVTGGVRDILRYLLRNAYSGFVSRMWKGNQANAVYPHAKVRPSVVTKPRIVVAAHARRSSRRPPVATPGDFPPVMLSSPAKATAPVLRFEADMSAAGGIRKAGRRKPALRRPDMSWLRRRRRRRWCFGDARPVVGGRLVLPPSGLAGLAGGRGVRGAGVALAGSPVRGGRGRAVAAAALALALLLGRPA